jgi:hypothetical protein
MGQGIGSAHTTTFRRICRTLKQMVNVIIALALGGSVQRGIGGLMKWRCQMMLISGGLRND